MLISNSPAIVELDLGKLLKHERAIADEDRTTKKYYKDGAPRYTGSKALKRSQKLRQQRIASTLLFVFHFPQAV